MQVSLQRLRWVITAARLRWRVFRLSVALRRRGIRCSVNVHYRPPAKAHRYSTAHHIGNGQITIGCLRQLPGGRDLDGNLWFDAGWARDLPDTAPANAISAIVDNARRFAPAALPYAEEGYGPADPRRAPNLATVPISRHVHGLAVDLNVDWKKIDGEWGPQTQAFLARFGLHRPQANEWWHVELV